jgi:protein SCO1/2
MTVRTNRIILILSVFLAGLVLSGLTIFLIAGRFSPPVQLGAAIGGPFRLVDQAGGEITEADLRGKPSLVFFGFTHCPDVCPTALFDMSEVLRALGKDADRVSALFVSVDPERDTPAALAAYLRSFDPEFVGLTGDKRAIEGLAQDLGVAMARTELPGDTYTMDHTSAIFLVDARGALVAVFTPPIESPNLAADLRGVASRLTG